MSDFAIFCLGVAVGAILTLVIMLMAQDAKRARDVAAEDAVREDAERQRLERAERQRILNNAIRSLTDEERDAILTGRLTIDDVMRARAAASPVAP